MNTGMIKTESQALIYVAEDQKFFVRNGLKLTAKDYESGSAAINAMMKGDIDAALTTEYPIVRKAFQKEQISIIGANVEFIAFCIVGRKDRGIVKVGDLKGKKIGLVRQGIGPFYLGRFLDFNGMSIRDVTLVDVVAAHWTDAMISGNVDAVVAFQPYINQIRNRLSNNIFIWPAQIGQQAFGVISCRNDWIRQHPEAIKRFLKSLAQAEDYTLKNPGETRVILQRRLNLDQSYLVSIWPDYRFHLSLSQRLIVAMKDEAQWMINNKLTSEKEIPDFVNYIYTEGLKTVKPEAVRIIR
jgi:NitT/TauT family transport system substrate-binding protein